MAFSLFDQFVDVNGIDKESSENPSLLLPRRYRICPADPFSMYLDSPELKNDPAEKLNRLAMALFVRNVHQYATTHGLPSSHICEIAEACLRHTHKVDPTDMDLVASPTFCQNLAENFAKSPLHAYVYVGSGGKVYFECPPFEGVSDLFKYQPDMLAYFRKATLTGNSPTIRGSATLNFHIVTSRDLDQRTADKEAYSWYCAFVDCFHEMAKPRPCTWPIRFKTSRSHSDIPLSIWISHKAPMPV